MSDGSFGLVLLVAALVCKDLLLGAASLDHYCWAPA